MATKCTITAQTAQGNFRYCFEEDCIVTSLLKKVVASNRALDKTSDNPPMQGDLELVLGTKYVLVLATGAMDVKVDGRAIWSFHHRCTVKIPVGEVRRLQVGQAELQIAANAAN